MSKPKLAVFKFTSCDGCQLSLLDCEDELLAVADIVDIAYFPEATRHEEPGPYDIALVEGSITTENDARRIAAIRESAQKVISIGACATSGGIQALRNNADIAEYIRLVYPSPEFVTTLATSTAISEHIDVDYELHGCPINKKQLIEVVLSCVEGRVPGIREHSVCMECKAAGNTCVMVVDRQPCLGPVTHSGCGALCPAYNRACYGCYGIKEQAQVESLLRWFHTEQQVAPRNLQQLVSTYHVADKRVEAIKLQEIFDD